MFFHNIFFTQKNDQAWFCQQNLWIWQAQYISSEKSLLYLTETVLQFDIFPPKLMWTFKYSKWLYVFFKKKTLSIGYEIYLSACYYLNFFLSLFFFLMLYKTTSFSCVLSQYVIFLINENAIFASFCLELLFWSYISFLL